MAEADLAMIDVLRKVIEGASVLTVFGAPVTQDGVTVIPVARVRGAGGAGGGGGPGPQGREAGGTGGGFALSARPAGVFVVGGGKVSWRPALDVNKVIMGGQIVAAVALLTLRALHRRRRRG
jgi:uncharacterized spore protein YtfJ